MLAELAAARASRCSRALLRGRESTTSWLNHADYRPLLAHPHALQCVNLAQNNISDPTYLLAMAFLPHLKWVNIQGNDMTAVQVQDVRDAFAERPDVQLLS